MRMSVGQNFPTRWDKLVYWGSILGLLFLAGVSFFKYYYVIPAQKDIPELNRRIEQLEKENSYLRSKIKSIQNEK